MEESERVMVAILPVLGETTAAIEPADGAFDDPAFRFNDEAFGVSLRLTIAIDRTGMTLPIASWKIGPE